MPAVCVFCGSSTPQRDAYVRAAEELAAVLRERELGLVYGGASVGLMGVLADAALRLGVEVTGIIPRGLFTREVPHTGLTALFEVDSMHERKQLMYELSDGFIALPGGLGTLEEFAEVTTWNQLGLHDKPIVLLDVDGFWSGLLQLFDRMVDDGLIKPANRALVQQATSPSDAVSRAATRCC